MPCPNYHPSEQRTCAKRSKHYKLISEHTREFCETSGNYSSCYIFKEPAQSQPSQTITLSMVEAAERLASENSGIDSRVTLAAAAELRRDYELQVFRRSQANTQTSPSRPSVKVLEDEAQAGVLGLDANGDIEIS